MTCRERISNAIGCALTYGFAVLSALLRRPMFPAARGWAK